MTVEKLSLMLQSLGMRSLVLSQLIIDCHRVFVVRILNLYALMGGWKIATEVGWVCIAVFCYLSVV